MFISVNPASGNGVAGDNRWVDVRGGDLGRGRDYSSASEQATDKDHAVGGAVGRALSCSLPVTYYC